MLVVVRTVDDCVISRLFDVYAESNAASRALHESCGFSATGKDPVNPWGELEEGYLLYRFEL